MSDLSGCAAPKFVRVQWWMQDTLESGHWETSGLMEIKEAQIYLKSGYYEQARIVLDEPGFPVYEGGCLERDL